MQEPLEERIFTIENATLAHAQMLQRLDTIVAKQDEMLDHILATQERLVANQDHIFATQEILTATQERLVANQNQIFATQDRLIANQERLVANQDQIFATQDRLIANQEVLTANQEVLIANQEVLTAIQERLAANQEDLHQLLLEVREDSARTQRLWFRLAQRYGWMDDEQNGAQPGLQP